VTDSSAAPFKRGEVELRPVAQMSVSDWQRFHRYFKDREIARLNGASPIFLPLWLFKRIVIGEEKSGERIGYAIYVAQSFVGSVEFYDLERPRQAVLGILIGEKTLWGKGYGTVAVGLALELIFQLHKFERVTLQTLDHNARARRSFERAGFHLTGFADAGKQRFAHYQITKAQWLTLNNPQP
jgi:RimJ/RimL family protein N-acetyltransferase